MLKRSLEKLDIIAQAKFLDRKWNRYRRQPDKGIKATEESIEKIERELEFKIPSQLIKISTIAKYYTVWFGSIGENYSSRDHILNLNREFTSEIIKARPLPDDLVLINHGYDGDCDCISRNDSGANSVEYFSSDFDYGGQRKVLAASFEDYLRYIAA